MVDIPHRLSSETLSDRGIRICSNPTLRGGNRTAMPVRQSLAIITARPHSLLVANNEEPPMQAATQGFNPEYSEEEPTPEELAALTGPAVLEFGAPWCGHCQAARSAIAEALAEYPDLTHIKVYDGKGKRLGRAFRVKLWPTLIFLRDGEEVERLVRPTAEKTVKEAMKAL